MHNDDFVADYQTMGRWVRDHVPLPGKAFRVLMDIVRTNALMASDVPVGDRDVHLADVCCPC
jgi:poly(3-hydroxyalkanoate) synthetase